MIKFRKQTSAYANERLNPTWYPLAKSITISSLVMEDVFGYMMCLL